MLACLGLLGNRFGFIPRILLNSGVFLYYVSFTHMRGSLDLDPAGLTMKRHCNNNMWWRFIRKKTVYCVAVGQKDTCYEVACFNSKPDAYAQKDRWLTEYGMFCV
jgi:hypothetical protein